MTKIFRCECRRLLCNKFFIGLLAVLLFYAGQVFCLTVLPGVSHTAPFSPWSFGVYLGRLLPLLWVGALFVLPFYTPHWEGRAAVKPAPTPADPRRYALTRCAAALVGTALLCLAALALAAVCYARLFGWYGWGSLVLPTLVTLAPPLVFALGSGWRLGEVRPWLLYVWMAFPFVLSALPLPQALGLWDGSFFAGYPLTLDALDPAFSMPASAWLAQGLTLALGLLLLALPARKKGV